MSSPCGRPLPPRSFQPLFPQHQTVQQGLRSLVLGALLILLVLGAGQLPLHAQSPLPSANPDLSPACGLDVTLILDESGSVGQDAQTVRAGARALLTSLADTGSRVALIEFNAQARAPLGANYLAVTTGPGGTLSPGGAFDTYLNSGYNPTDATNWDGALTLAATINANHGAAELVIFFTDGNPNVYVTPEGNNLPGDAITARDEAIGAANALKGQGSHLFALGVGNVNTANLILVSGPDQYPQANLPFRQSDYTLITFDQFIPTLRTIAYNLCTPYLTLTKLVDEADGAGYQGASGWYFSSTVQVSQTGQPATAYEWLSPMPGTTSQLGQSQSAVTDQTGRAQWQWSPGTVNTPQPWASTLHLAETARTGYQFIDASCLRRTLDPLNDFVESTFTLAALPATLTYGPNDVINCTIRNARVALTVEKTVLPASLVEPGGEVTYSYTVRNSGAVDLQLLSLVDARLQNLNGQGTCHFNAPLLLTPGASYQCAVQTSLAGNAGTRFDDSVVATAMSANGQLTAGANTLVTLSDALPVALVTKTAQTTALPEPGGPVTFDVTVSNLGSAEALQLTALQDAPYGDITQPSTTILATTCAVGQNLAPAGQPNATYRCSFTANVVGNAGLYRDELTATLRDDENNTINPQAAAVVTLTDVPSSLRVTKGATPLVVPEPGGLVTFVVLVENTSAVDQVTLQQLLDSQQGLLSSGCTAQLPTTLAVGASIQCLYQTQIQGNLGDSYTNALVASGVDDDGQPVSDQDQVTIAISNVPSALLVTKQASQTTAPEPGAPITYTVTIRNSSPADPVTITEVTDSLRADVATTCRPSIPAVLAVGATMQCVYTQAVSGPVGALVVNQFTARGLDDDGQRLLAGDQEEVRIVDVPSSLQVTKSATPSTVPETGGAVTYVVTIRNSSAVDQVTLQQVSDNRFGDITATCLPALPVRLNPAAAVACTFTRTVTGDVGTPHVSSATASGIDDDGFAVSGANVAMVTFHDARPIVTISKTATPAAVLETGELVTFGFVVQNGAEAVTLLTLQDSVFGDLNGRGSCTTPQAVPANGSYQCNFVTTIAGFFGVDHQNQVVATAQDNEGNVTTATAQMTVRLLDAAPDLRVTKTDRLYRDNPSDPADYIGRISPGDTLSYTIVLHNVGNQGAINVAFDDMPDPNSQLIVGSVRSSRGTIRIGNRVGETKVVVDVGNIGVNETVTVQFRVLITEGRGVNALLNQATIINFDPALPGGASQTLSDDPDTPAPNDATITIVNIPPTNGPDEPEPESGLPKRFYLPLIER